MRSKHTLMSTRYSIIINEESDNRNGGETPEVVEIYRQRVTEIDLGAIIGAINKVPRKTRADKGSKKPAEGGAK